MHFVSRRVQQRACDLDISIAQSSRVESSRVIVRAAINRPSRCCCVRRALDALFSEYRVERVLERWLVSSGVRDARSSQLERTRRAAVLQVLSLQCLACIPRIGVALAPRPRLTPDATATGSHMASQIAIRLFDAMRCDAQRSLCVVAGFTLVY